MLLPFDTLVHLDRSAGTPVYQQLANRLIALILEGALKPGMPLPASREMATLLNLHRKTVIAAYDELQQQDWIYTVERKGIFIAENLPEIKPRSFKAAARTGAYAENASFPYYEAMHIALPLYVKQTPKYTIDDGFPDPRLAPMDELLKASRELMRIPENRYGLISGASEGAWALREALTTHLNNSRGLNIHSQNILITRGGQMGIHLAASLLLKPGDKVIVAAPNYHLADLCFQQLGAHLVRVPVDAEGIDVDRIASILEKQDIRLLYIIPHHHQPTTVTLSAERRMKLLTLIRQYKLPVIEDDYDYEFHYSGGPLLPLASAPHQGQVIYIGSINKSLALPFRSGYMVAPPDFIAQCTYLRRMIDLRGDTLMEASLAKLFENGTIQRHLKKSSKLYEHRRDVLCDTLSKQLGSAVQFTSPQGGMAVWAQFDPSIPLVTLARRAGEMGLRMSDGSSYKYGVKDQNALRIGYAALNDEEIRAVVGILRKSVEGK
ncbi:GntR family transcriptional regulator [Chitinophaga parva]|uniref:GntR family transcriptional regulator n=1 Tax=Chitinophaga parva TaxID=2169414 RepID=A0A2T7BI28_9BACT|nr:PLP-dependent aminotransferase family protein [Chitinophaga parva]PUZ25937.1 GntR family transcriptional regulator [Chitinophaga parva]